MGISNAGSSAGLSAKARNRLLRIEKILGTFSSDPYIPETIRRWAEDTESQWQKNLKKLRTKKTKSKVSENKMGGGKIKKNYSKGGGVRPTSY